MRTITHKTIADTVARVISETNRHLPDDVKKTLETARHGETNDRAQDVLDQILKNVGIAGEMDLPICQDTGLVVIMARLGCEVRLEKPLEQAIFEGVRRGTQKGRLRASVCDPFSRKNTGDNTPPVIHLETEAGDALTLSILCKGGGSDNMSRLFMRTPAEGWDGIRESILQTVSEAGPNACPPLIIGVGVGGSFDMAPRLARRALLRPVDVPGPLAKQETDFLEAVNKLNIGPMGYGGRTTALAVHIESAPCHIASLPVAVNLQCHAARHAEVIL